MKTKKLYIGVSEHLDDRIEAHNLGYNKSTKHGRPWALVFTKIYESKSLAMAREKKLKNLKSKKKVLHWIAKNKDAGSIPENPESLIL